MQGLSDNLWYERMLLGGDRLFLLKYREISEELGALPPMVPMCAESSWQRRCHSAWKAARTSQYFYFNDHLAITPFSFATANGEGSFALRGAPQALSICSHTHSYPHRLNLSGPCGRTLTHHRHSNQRLIICSSTRYARSRPLLHTFVP